jgi:DNA-directed RNA polymerase subunit N (RpoN/RPB10)
MSMMYVTLYMLCVIHRIRCLGDGNVVGDVLVQYPALIAKKDDVIDVANVEPVSCCR